MILDISQMFSSAIIFFRNILNLLDPYKTTERVFKDIHCLLTWFQAPQRMSEKKASKAVDITTTEEIGLEWKWEASLRYKVFMIC